MTGKTAWDAIAEQLDQLEKPVHTFKLCRDADVRDRYLSAQDAHASAQADLKALPDDTETDVRAILDTRVKNAKTELAAAKKAYDAVTVTLRFAALERKELEKLQRAHPAGEEDEAKGADFAMDSFAPELIAAASLDGMPVEAARKYLDTWSTADASTLWQAAWSIQHQRRTDLGKG